MGHKHSVYDSDAHFSIDPITRKIKNESSKKTTLVQGDHNSERCTFDVPRYIEGHDMMQCSEIEVHYDNIETGTSNVSSDYYEVKDKQISPDDKNVVIFSWLIIDTATKYAGSLEFSIKFKCVEGGVSDYEWNTLSNTDLSVGKGKNNSGAVVERAPNVVDQWKEEIFGDAENAVANINLAEQNAIAAVQAEGANQVEVVRAAGEAIEASRDQIFLNKALKAAVIEGNAEGEVILLNDSAEAAFVGMNVFGKSGQFTTTGKQLLNNTIDTFTTNGITFTTNEDGSITVCGTTSTNEAYCLFDFRNDIPKYGEELIASISGSSDVAMVVGYFTAQDVFVNEIVSVNSEVSRSFTFPDEAIATRIFLAVGQGKTVDATVYPLIRLATIEDDSFEPYTGGVPSPNPDYPQEINSVENPKVSVFGKNLVNVPDFDSVLYSNSIASREVAAVLPLGVPLIVDYTYEGNGTPNSSTNYTVGIAFVGEEQRMYAHKGESFVIEKEVQRITIYGDVTDTATEGHFSNISIRLADTDERFEAYKEKQTVALNHTLHGIPVTSGGNYTDENGQQWICDEVDLKRGVLVQRIGKIVFDEKQNYHLNAYQQNNGYFVFGCTMAGFSKSELPMISDRLIFKPWGYWNLASGGDLICYESSSFYMYMRNQTIQTPDAFKEYLLENPITALYILATPIETALTAEEIEAFKTLHSNFQNTTIMNGAAAHMAVKYGIDTKTYIDNKFEELKNTILNP